MEKLAKDILKNAKNHLILENNNINEVQLARVINSIKKVIEASNIARREGLLALEEYSNNLASEIENNNYFKKLIMLIVDGTDPEFVDKIIFNQLCVMGIDSFDAFLGYIIGCGVLCVQAGVNPRIIEEELYSCLPKEVLNIVKKAIKKEQSILTQEHIKSQVERWHNYIPQKTDNVFFRIFLKKFSKYSDGEIQRIFREIETEHIAQVALFCDKDTRKIFSKNISDRLIAYIMDDFWYLDESKLSESVEKFMKVIVRLEDIGEIISHDDLLN